LKHKHVEIANFTPKQSFLFDIKKRNYHRYFKIFIKFKTGKQLVKPDYILNMNSGRSTLHNFNHALVTLKFQGWVMLTVSRL